VTRPSPAQTGPQQQSALLGTTPEARQSRSATRTSELVARLREELLAGVLKPGEPLRLAVVRERYGAGLTPLREALFQLTAEGLVTMEDQRGFRVAEVSQEDLTDLTEQRVFIEGQALRLAIERGDLAWESRVLAAHHRLAGTPMLEPGMPTLTDAWTEAHRDFHRVLVEACGSVWLLRFRDVLSDQAERYRRLSIRNDPGRDVAGEHRRIAEATLARAPERAVQCLAAHYRLTAQLCHLPSAD
jgi:DNA-binding GntR family transcriptional regulator